MNDTLFAQGADAAMLADSVDHFLADHYTFEQRRKRLAMGPGQRGCWAQLAELGWLGLPLPESLGGYAGRWLDVAMLMQRFGRALVVEPYIANVVLAGGLLARVGSQAQQLRWLQPMMEGRAQLALAYLERASRHTWQQPQAEVGVRNGRTELNGRKSVVLGGATADAFIVWARDSDALRTPALFLIERGRHGVSCVPTPTIDGHAAAELTFDAVRVSADDRVGTPTQALDQMSLAIDTAAALSCAEGIGVMEALFHCTLDYLKQRQQFGRPLASNQALQHRLVDMHALLREAEGLAQWAVEAIDAEPAVRAHAVSTAKVHVGQALRHIGQEAVQLHGAIGTTDEYPLSHHFKRATALSLLFGDVDHHRARLGLAMRNDHRPRAA